jgi:hypothetical protein
MSFEDELQTLVAETAEIASTWAALESWHEEPGSPAAAELANTETGPAGPWNDRPVRSAYALAQMAINAAVEQARGLADLITLGRSAPAPDTLARAALEAAGVAWWLLAVECSCSALTARGALWLLADV